MDAGYDEKNNPFADVTDEYTKQREDQFAKMAQKKISAQQKQIQKVRQNPDAVVSHTIPNTPG